MNVLLVPDTFPWILGTWAKQIALNGKRHRYFFFSTALYARHPVTWDALVAKMDVIHVLTPHGFSDLSLPEDKASVGTIHHVVKWDELAPVVQADALCYSADEWRDYLRQKAGVPQERLFEIRSGVDTEMFRPRGSKAEARRRLGLPDDAYVVGFFGKASSDDGGRKAVDVLVKTFDRLQEQGRRAGLLITGPGWTGLVRALRATGTPVTHCPFLRPDMMPVAYNALDAYLITARAEGGPVPLLEAMASAIPVVTTPVGVVPRVVQDGANGLIIPKNSPEAAATALMTLMEDPGLADELGRRARQTILDGWQWRHTLHNIDDLYDLAAQIRAQRTRDHSLPTDAPQNAPPEQKKQPDVAGKSNDRPASALLDPDPKAQREAVLFEDTLQWHQHLSQTGHSSAALELSLDAWKSQPLNLHAGANLARLSRQQARQRILPGAARTGEGSRISAPIPAGHILTRRVVDWVKSMGSPAGERFDFRISADLPSDLLGQCFAVLSLELFGVLPQIPAADRARWRSQIANTYQAETGYFVEPSLVPSELPVRGHNWQYITWQSTMFARSALGALGDATPYPMKFLQPFEFPERMVAWLDERDWRNPWLESNNVMFIALFLLQECKSAQEDTNGAAAKPPWACAAKYEASPGTGRTSLDAMFKWLDDHQNPVTGYWDLGRNSSLLNAMAGAFHFYFLYFLTGQRVHYPERILESTLALQQSDGLFDSSGGGGACLDLDAIDILVKFSQLTDYRSADVKSALTRAFDGILKNQNPDGGFCEAHRPPAWKKSRKRQLAESVGLDRLLNRPWQGRPDEFISVSSIKALRHRVEESDLWATWFRSLALALISTRYPGEFIRGVNWQFKIGPTLGWHDTWQLQRVRQEYRT